MLGWLSSPHARTPLTAVLGNKPARALERAFGFTTVGQALTNFPQRWVQAGTSLNVSWEDLGDTITTVVQVHSIAPPASSSRAPLKIVVSDGVRHLPAAIFGQEWLRPLLYPGVRLLILATLSEYRGNLQLTNVDCLILNADGSPGPATGKLATLTKSAEGLGEMRRLLSRPHLPIYRGRKPVSGLHLALYMQRIVEWLPHQRERLPEPPEELPSFDTALREIHFPQAAGPQAAITRLKYDEAFEIQLAVAQRARTQAGLEAPPAPATQGQLRHTLRAGLPFALTSGQEQVVATLAKELAGSRPMNRLLAGEVGSGKTVVALLAMLQVIDSGRQCVFLAPTEVLASQHHRSLSAMLERAGVAVRVHLLTGSAAVARRRETLLAAISGDADIIVGTHALLSEGVDFFDLGLVVVDEQHRFGVRQRDQLRSRGRDGMTPHLLLLSATPIPRTVAMTVFGDLAVSQLTEVPAGRPKIETFVVPTVQLPRWEERTWERIGEEISQGNRVFIVCPRIKSQPGDGPDESVEAVFARARELLPQARLAALHGGLPGPEKDAIMTAFAAGELDVLVSTTVIEVGVDVPEATIMMIRRAESFGISQLHQLRGRIGRGNRGGLCFLCTHTLPESPERKRLEQIAVTYDGIALAELDLANRNFGDLLGDEQSGVTKTLGLIRLDTDGEIIDASRTAAAAVLAGEAEQPLIDELLADINEEQSDYLDRS